MDCLPGDSEAERLQETRDGERPEAGPGVSWGPEAGDPQLSGARRGGEES